VDRDGRITAADKTAIEAEIARLQGVLVGIEAKYGQDCNGNMVTP
jgi:hypothetical protein